MRDTAWYIWLDELELFTLVRNMTSCRMSLQLFMLNSWCPDRDQEEKGRGKGRRRGGYRKGEGKKEKETAYFLDLSRATPQNISCVVSSEPWDGIASTLLLHGWSRDQQGPYWRGADLANYNSNLHFHKTPRWSLCKFEIEKHKLEVSRAPGDGLYFIWIIFWLMEEKAFSE